MPEDRKPKTELRFCHFRPKKRSVYLRRPKAEGRIPEAWPGPARGAGARRPKTESRIAFLPFSPKKKVRVPPKTESRRPNPESPARGAGARKPKTELRFGHFRQKKERSGYLRRPKAEGRIPKAGPGPRGRGPKTENRKPNNVFAIFAKKMIRVPRKTESRRPNPESWARPDRKPKTELRFGHFRPKKKTVRVPPKTESRRPNPEGWARPGPRGRGPKIENRITFWPFSPKKMVRVPPKTESRRPNPESPARPDRKPKTESRSSHFCQKNGPGTSEDRKPKAESRKLGPARGAGARRPKTENRITFLPLLFLPNPSRLASLAPLRSPPNRALSSETYTRCAMLIPS